MRKITRKVVRAAEPAAVYGDEQVKIAEFKTHLSRHLRSVRSGNSLTIMDRNTPIATVQPIRRSSLVIHPATKTWADVQPLLARIKPSKIDPVAILLEMRKDRV